MFIYRICFKYLVQLPLKQSEESRIVNTISISINIIMPTIAKFIRAYDSNQKISRSILNFNTIHAYQ